MRKKRTSRKQILLRTARKSDCRNLFRWRNDPDTRRLSFSTERISFKQHQSWFFDSLISPRRILRIAIFGNGTSFGVIRLDLKRRGVATVSINLAPKARGKGYGAVLLKKTAVLAKRKYHSKTLLAFIKRGNNASVSAFMRAGFCLKGVKGNCSEYILKLK